MAWHLRGIDWLSTLSRAQADAVRRASQTRTHARGETIFLPTQHPNHVYLLEKGLVRLLRLSPTGQELTLDYVRPGELFGALPVIVGSARETLAVARTPALVLRIPQSVFLTVVRSTNSVLYEVTKRIGQRLVRLQSRMEDLVFRDVRSRLARILLNLAEEHGRETAHGLSIGLPLNQEEIATLIGTTRQSVSTSLHEMKSAGLVERHGRELVITGLPGLRTLAARTSPPRARRAT